MSIPSPGRKEPTVPELSNSIVLVSVGLKKKWAKSSSYWIEIYGKPGHHPGGLESKPIRFFLYRQWAFIKGSMMSEQKELIEGGALHPSLITKFDLAVQGLLAYARKQILEKGYEVASISTLQNLNSLEWGRGMWTTIEDLEAKLRSIKAEDCNNELSIEISDSKPIARRENFWDTARHREKKSKW